MLPLSELLEDAGSLVWILAPAGALGALAALAALSAVAFRAGSRATLRLGAGAVALGVFCGALGGAGVVHGRMVTDEAVQGDQSPVGRQRLRRDGYLAARAPAELGLMGAALPLLAGLAAMFAGARRRAREEAPEPDPDLPFAPRARWGAPVGAAVAGLLSTGFAVATLVDRVPGRNLRADATARHVLDHLEDRRFSAEGSVLLDACADLELEMTRRRDTLDPGRIPALPAVTRRCVEARIQKAAVLSSIGDVRAELEAVSRSSLVSYDKGLQRLVQGTLEEVKQIAVAHDKPAWLPPHVKDGEVTVSRGLAAGVVQRVVRERFGKLRACYEESLDDPASRGWMNVRFIVGQRGAVSAVTGAALDALDAGLVPCVQRVFAEMSFPPPEGGARR